MWHTGTTCGMPAGLAVATRQTRSCSMSVARAFLSRIAAYCVFFAFPQGQPPAAGIWPFVPSLAAPAACLHAAAPQQPPPGMHPPCSAAFASAAGAAASGAAAGGRRSSSEKPTALTPSMIAVRNAATIVRFIAPPDARRPRAPPTVLTDPIRVSTTGRAWRQIRGVSRLQQRAAPAAPGPHEQLPVVQPVLAVAPELDGLGHEAETRPVRRTRHLVAGIPPADLPREYHEG